MYLENAHGSRSVCSTWRYLTNGTQKPALDWMKFPPLNLLNGGHGNVIWETAPELCFSTNPQNWEMPRHFTPNRRPFTPLNWLQAQKPSDMPFNWAALTCARSSGLLKCLQSFSPVPTMHNGHTHVHHKKKVQKGSNLTHSDFDAKLKLPTLDNREQLKPSDTVGLSCGSPG